MLFWGSFGFGYLRFGYFRFGYFGYSGEGILGGIFRSWKFLEERYVS